MTSLIRERTLVSASPFAQAVTVITKCRLLSILICIGDVDHQGLIGLDRPRVQVRQIDIRIFME